MTSTVDGGPGAGVRAIDAPLRDEVTRQRLIDRLAERWNVRLLTIEAPGGFGKSTALAQAVRDNALDPSGIDIVVRVTALHGSAEDVFSDAVAQLVETQLEVRGSAGIGGVAGERRDVAEPSVTGRNAAAQLIAEVARRSPNDVTLWIDDANRLNGPADHEAIADLLDALPANGHLAIAGRSLPRLPIARLAAADAVVSVGTEELRFDAHELGDLAAEHGAEAESLAHTEGWPAMSRLALVSEERSREYVFDEVVAGLDELQRTAVAIAQIAGTADADLFRECGVDIDPDRLVRSVPLVSKVGDGVVAHDLWTDVGVEFVDAEHHAELVRRVATILCERRRFSDAIDVALRHEAWSVAGTAIVELLYDGDGLIGGTAASRWSAAFPPEQRDEPEVQLLDGVRARLAGGVRDGVELVQAATLAFADRENGRGFAAGLTELGIRGWAAGDGSILQPVLHLVGHFYRQGEPQVARLIQRQVAADADLAGNYRAALDAYRGDRPIEVLLRHRATLHFFCGETGPEAELVDELVERAPSDFNRRIRAMHYFMAGDPTLVVDGECPGLEVVDNSREQPLHLVWESVVDASFGRVPPVETITRVPLHRVREQMFVAVVQALAAIVDHDEHAAGAIIDDAIGRHGADHPMVLGELLRFASVAYGSSPTAAALIDAAEPTGWHLDRVEMTQLLTEGRAAGSIQPSALPPARHLFTVFPLPWSVEAIALAAADDVEQAGVVLDELTAFAGRGVQAELRWLSQSDRSAAAGARRLLSSVPLPPDTSTTVRLFGSPTVERGDRSVPISGRRSRRLIAELAVTDRMSRTDLADALWPESPQDKALASLRVAIRDVRKLLDPDRDKGSAPFHLRDRLGDLMLADTEFLRIDVRDAARSLDAADAIDAGRAAGDSAAERRRAFELVRLGWAEEFDDLETVADVFRALRVRAVNGMCLVAERHLANDEPAAALAAAAAVIESDPLVERAHAARIAAHLATGDLEAAGSAIDACTVVLDELGVDAQPGTHMLIRRYERRMADARRADLSVERRHGEG